MKKLPAKVAFKIALSNRSRQKNGLNINGIAVQPYPFLTFKQYKSMKFPINEALLTQSFDFDNADTETIGYYFKCYFGQSLVSEFRRNLTSDAMNILQNAIQSHPVKNLSPQAHAALLFLSLYVAFEDADQSIYLYSFTDSQLGDLLINTLCMFQANEIIEWADIALVYYASRSEKNSSLIDEQIIRGITTLSRLKEFSIKVASATPAAA